MNITNLTRAVSERGSFLPLRVFLDNAGAPGTGETVTVSLSRESDGLLYDWSDGVFKLDPDEPLGTVVESSLVPGLYEISVNHASLVEPDRLLFVVTVTGAILPFAVEAADRTDPAPDLAVQYDAEAEKFVFVATLMTRDGLAESATAEPSLTVRGADGSLVFEADYEDFDEDAGVFRYEYSGVEITAGAWVAVLSFEAFGATYSAEFAFGVGE